MAKPKLVTCSGWHTKDDVEESLQAATSIADFRYWLQLMTAWPGPVTGFGETEKKAGADAKAKMKAASTDFCKVLRGCGSETGKECGFANYRAKVVDAWEPSFEGADWMVAFKVTEVKCSCPK